MVEDALKVTRNLQRLLLVVCGVAAIFLASLREVSAEQAVLAGVARLPTVLDDSGYHRWLVRRSREVLDARNDEVEELMSRLLLWLPSGFNASELSQVLATPAHISRVSVPRWDLRQHSILDLAQLKTQFQVITDARLAVAEADDDLLEQLREAIGELSPSPQASIRNTHLHLLEPPPVEQPHIYLDAAAESRPLELYFEVYTPGRSAPTRTLAVEATWYTIADSAILDWWNSEGLPWEHLVFIESSARSVVPPLDLSKSIAELRNELEGRVATARASNRTIDLAGISIPGSLALFGIPAILLGFAGSLLIHLRHLHRLAAEHRQTFQQFSWTPVSPGDLWLWETTGLLLVLPVAVHLLLIYRAPAFGETPLLALFAGFGGAVGTALAGVALLRSIARLRRRLYLR